MKDAIKGLNLAFGASMGVLCAVGWVSIMFKVIGYFKTLL